MFCIAGCAQTVREVASTAGGAAGKAAAASAPPALVSGLASLNSPKQQQELHSVASSPGMQEATRTLGAGLGRGMVDELFAIATGASTTQPADHAASYASVRMPSDTHDRVTMFMQRNIDPAIAEIVRSVIREGTAAATSDEAQARVHSMAEVIGDGAIRGAVQASKDDAPMIGQLIREQLGPAVGDAVRQQVGPAWERMSQERFTTVVHDLLRQEVVPAVRQAWDQAAADTLLIPVRPDVSPAVIQNAQNLSVGATYGTHDALIHLGVLSTSGDLTVKAKALLWGGTALLGLVVLMFAALLAVLTLIAVGIWRGRLLGMVRPEGR